MLIRRIVRRVGAELRGIINYLRGARIYVDRCEHPIWKSYHDYPPVPYTSEKLALIRHYFNYIRDDPKPFVVEYEHVLVLSGKTRDYVSMVEAAPAIEEQLRSENCRAIIMPTLGAIRETRKYINTEGLEHKFYMVRPAYPIQPDYDPPREGPFRLLTVGNKFWGKGIPIAIEAFRLLRENYGNEIAMTIACSDIPASYPLPDGLEVITIPNMDKKMRSQLYLNSHVFVFPCLHDSFAVYQEAMAYGVPMVATSIYDKDELVLDGKTGFLIDPPFSLYDGQFGVEWRSWAELVGKIQDSLKEGLFKPMIEEMVASIDLLINDRNMLVMMGEAAQKLHRESFSIEVRNNRIRKIYDMVM
jgi:glycosyltransferase involved in cell wall biosynthesis